MVSMKTLGGLGKLLLLHSCLALAYPPSYTPLLNSDTGAVSTRYNASYDGGINKRADSQDFYLRIMPLGASITKGDFPPKDDPHHNGYRKALRDKLRFEGWKVNMVGNFNNWGDMADRDHEGKSGDRVSEVKTRAQQSVRTWLPNVVLINAGTNDATQDGKVEDIGGTGARMKQLVDVIYSIVPDTVIILSTLIPNPDFQHNIDTINEQFRSLYRGFVPLDKDGKERSDPTFKMVLAEMADGFITDDDILPDVHPTHPTAEGDRKMAAVWHWAIAKANDKGWIKKPTDSTIFKDGDADVHCKKPFASGTEDSRGAPEVLKGTNPVIQEDSKFKSNNILRKDRRGDWSTFDVHATRLWFAQLWNEFGTHKLRERDELIIAYGTGNRITMQANHGDGKFGDEQDLDIPIYCKTKGIRWGDVNGDILDDFICIAEDGEMFVAINQGGSPPTFKDIGSYKKPEKKLGQDNVRLGDMDGDGRLDYCVLEGNGDLYCWRNGGIGEHAEYWQDMGSGGPIFHGKGMGDLEGVRLVDINGDGRADWLWLDDKGKTTSWINNHGAGRGMAPRWASVGVTHDLVSDSILDDRRGVQFGRIFGDSGVADYVHWWRVGCQASSKCKYTWKGWQQKGGGSRFQKGDGINFGDMTGKGVDDYVWIRPWSKDGEVEIFINKNTKTNSDGYKTQPWSAPVRVNTNLDWRGLHVGDWDGDGRQDIIGVTNRDTGSLKVWLSRWDGHNFNWDVQDVPGSDKCGEGWGTLYRDHGAHFADITNSGRVDYLCMQPDGKTTAWLRDEKGGWFNAGQVKRTEGKDRANLQFADADGDGRADLIWTDKFTGDAEVWYNLQQGQESDRANWHGSLFEWAPPSGPSYQGPTRGPNEYFPNLGGAGRADVVGADPWTAKATVWFNACPTGGDDGPITDPKLPTYNPSDSPPDDPPPPNGAWFCEVHASEWDASLWNRHNMGPWLKNRLALYSGVDETWPRSPNPKDNPDQYEGVPRVIAAFDGPVKDVGFYWDTTCRELESKCEMTESDLRTSEHCMTNPERAFALWSMRNYARFFQGWQDTIRKGFSDSSWDIATIASTFLQYEPEDSPTSPASWVGIAAGAVTAGTAFFAPVAAAGGFVSGILTSISGILGLLGDATVPNDPRFSEYSDLMSNLGDILNASTGAIGDQMGRMLNTTPPDHDLARGTELAEVLKLGAFANSDFVDRKGAMDIPETKYFIQSGMITEAWLSGSVGIIKWSNESFLAQKWKFNPCFGGDRFKLDHAVACQFGKNYMITRLVTIDMSGNEVNGVYEIPDVGQKEDTLKDYGLDHRIIIKSAERIQNDMNQYMPRGVEYAQSVIQSLFDNPSDNYETIFEDLLAINLPVCDLDILKDLDMSGPGSRRNTYCTNGAAVAYDAKVLNRCLIDAFNINCKKLPKLGDSEWPYRR